MTPLRVDESEFDRTTSRFKARDTRDASAVPMLLTVDDTARMLRTTKRAIYAMIERRQLPGIVRIGRRVLVRSDELLHWLDQKSAPSQRSAVR